ncbi:MAG: DUF561 domain-containing protein [Pseudanabaenaceae cyanobacterium bins.68]|nr:DUF561 domain-containing protein [Pseudanabaenaceae cyanobacterium bins.68]
MTINNRIPPSLQAAFSQANCLKIISGLQNFDPTAVEMVVKAAGMGGANYVDIAARADLIAIAKRASDLPVCVSGVNPEILAQAVAWGADLVEIGNYDSFYRQGQEFSAAEVIDLTLKTRALLGDQVALAVTVPHALPLDLQVSLAERLVEVGADLIQTEGGTSATPNHAGVLGLIEKAAPTLAAAYQVSRAVSVPVICASGLSSVTVALAIASGAKAVGVGSAVNKLQDLVAMVAVVRGLRQALDLKVGLRV